MVTNNTHSLEANIRPLVLEDLSSILIIEQEGHRLPWSESVFRDCFQRHYRLWALESGSQLIGYAIVACLMDEAHLLNLCVSRRLQGQGHGRHLLRHLCEYSRKEKMSVVTLEVRESNAPAIHLYRSEGFRALGVRRGYYSSAEGDEDALVMTLPLERDRNDA